MQKILFLQLPVPPPAYYASTGNVPLAGAVLASALKNHIKNYTYIEIIPPEITDLYGDTELISFIIDKKPDYLCASLYLWNTERTLYIIDKVKEFLPSIHTIVGGPEVSYDNEFILKNLSIDFYVFGEAEETIVNLIECIDSKKNYNSIPSIAFREKSDLNVTNQNYSANFKIQDYPSPYLDGTMKIDSNRSIYIETVRGCKSQCTYCFYPKSSQNLRMLSLEDTNHLISNIKEKGANEVIFLDPTFNHRPNFEKFLDQLIEINFDHQMHFFAELRSEGLNDNIIKKLKKANFNRIELGMQSVNKSTLERVKRYGDPIKVLETAKMFDSLGIELLLDIIIGLPGDKKQDVLRGVEFFEKEGLREWVQAFFLSVLPGTVLRKDAKNEGLIYDYLPSYRVSKTEDLTTVELIETFFEAEDILQRRLDEYPRPNLVEYNPNSNDVFIVDTDINFQLESIKPGARHQSIWFKGINLYSKLDLILKVINKKNLFDPYCIFDIILNPNDHFPIDCIEELTNFLHNLQPQSYLSKVLKHRNEDLQRRLVVVLDDYRNFDKGWISIIQEIIPVFINVDIEFAVKNIKKARYKLPNYRIISSKISDHQWDILNKIEDPENITFLNRFYEQKWTETVLSYNE
jgi:radical SAM superfamily enzyme YgiQ (UPF0313 family)